MKLSHSKLSLALKCPMSYFLSYKEGIELKETKPALAIGSAVHWGLEHDTDDLEEYYKTEGNFFQQLEYGKNEVLAEAMVKNFLAQKDNIYAQILQDDDGNILELLDVQKELEIYAKLKSYKYDEPHEFMGIIDLLFLTEKGFIIVDYKTSSQTPDWTKYLDQLYRYIFLLKENFPDTPVYKIAIINLKKSGIKPKVKENTESFLNRLKLEYEINGENYLDVHIYDKSDIDENLMNEYIDNLSKMADMAQNIDNNKMWYINFTEANGQYGKSDFYDIFYKTPDAYIFYRIRDTIFDEFDNSILDKRDCVPIDMQVIDYPDKVLNKYSIFKEQCSNIFKDKSPDKDKLFKQLKKDFITDDSLLEKYWINLEKNVE